MFSGRYGGRGYSRGGISMAHVAAFQTLVQYAALPRKPQVTTAIIAANVAAYYKPGILRSLLPPLRNVCLNPRDFVQTLDWKRLILSAFYHSGEVHLIYNMISLLWKGYQLEMRLGSVKFAKLVALLLVLSHSTLVAVSFLLATYTSWVSPYKYECAVGFSAVLFAMKTILNDSEPTYTRMQGFSIPTRYASWAELFLIQMVVPNASFTGHLSGIIAAHIYLNVVQVWPIGRGLWNRIWALLPAMRLRKWSGRSYTLGRNGSRSTRGEARETGRDSSRSRRGQSDGSPQPSSSEPRVWRCIACTYDNPPGAEKCEMCEKPRGRDPGPSSARLSEGWTFDDYIPSSPVPEPTSWTDQHAVEETPPRPVSTEDVRQRHSGRFRFR